MNADLEARLTVAIIVKNAAEALEATLNSIRSLADQVVVVDTGSTDRTRSVALSRGAQLIESNWQDSFAEARNEAWRAVLGDWVLWLDAGETLSAEDAAGLRSFVREAAQPDCAYAFLVQVPPLGAAIAQEQVARVRLVPDVEGLDFAGRVRESLKPSLERIGLRVEGLPYRITRGIAEHCPDRKKRRSRRNIQLADIEIAASGPTPHLLNCLGESFQALGEPIRAAQQYRLALETAATGSAEMLEAYYGLLTCLEGDPANRETQLTICLEALEVYPYDAQLLCALGHYLYGTNRVELAERSFEVAFRYGTIHPEVWHLTEIREIAAHCWSHLLQGQGKQEAAQRSLEVGLAEHPESWRLRRALIEMYARAGRRLEALAQFEAAPRNLPGREVLRNAVRGAALAGAGNWLSGRAYLQTAFQAGCQDVLCFRWLILALITLGEPDAAREIVSTWQRHDPHNPEPREFARLLKDGTAVAPGLVLPPSATGPAMPHVTPVRHAG